MNKPFAMHEPGSGDHKYFCIWCVKFSSCPDCLKPIACTFKEDPRFEFDTDMDGRPESPGADRCHICKAVLRDDGSCPGCRLGGYR